MASRWQRNKVGANDMRTNVACAAMLIVTVLFGAYAVRTIPPEGQENQTRKQLIGDEMKKWFIQRE